MLKMAKNIALALGLLVINSGQNEVLASQGDHELNNDNNKQVVVVSSNALDPATVLPQDVMKLIMLDASRGTNPCHMAFVNKLWRKIMREGLNFQPFLKIDSLNPFMKRCMNIYGDERFRNSTILYTKAEGNKLEPSYSQLNFSETLGWYASYKNLDLQSYLALFGDRGQAIRVVTSLEDYFIVTEQDDANVRIVMLIAPYDLLAANVEGTTLQIPQTMMDGWDKTDTPVRVFMRAENNRNLFSFDTIGVKGLNVVEAISTIDQNWRYLAFLAIFISDARFQGAEGKYMLKF